MQSLVKMLSIDAQLMDTKAQMQSGPTTLAKYFDINSTYALQCGGY